MSKYVELYADVFRKVRSLSLPETEESELVSMIDELFGVTEDYSMDLCYCHSLINGSWPDAQEIMAKHGWVRGGSYGKESTI